VPIQPVHGAYRGIGRDYVVYRYGPPARSTKPRSRLKGRQRDDLVRVAVAIMQRWEASRWQFEGPVRAGLRSAFCLNGWRWDVADVEAAAIAHDALVRIGAGVRPSWQEGQPEFTQYGVLPNWRTHCAHCHRPIPEDEDRKYCSLECGRAAASRMQRRQRLQDGAAYDAIASRARVVTG
jgi:predicted nucleic acid-binding Zn ribbon protein